MYCFEQKPQKKHTQIKYLLIRQIETDEKPKHNQLSNLKIFIMKRFFSLMTLFLAGGALLMTSCSSDDDDDNGGSTTSKAPFASVTAKDGASTMTATVDDTEKTIKFGEFQNTTDMSAVEVTFKMNKGHILKTPKYLTSDVDLTIPVKVVVLLNGKTEETYTMTAVVPEVPEAVLGAKVDGVDATVGEDKSISIKWQDGMEINHMVFELELAEGAKVVSPEDLAFDLEFGEGKLVVNYLNEDITYTVKATDYVDPLLSNGWEDITINYGTLPAYIKIYKTDKAGGADGTKACIAIIGKQATMGVVGEGLANGKTILDLENEGGYNVYLVGVNSASPSVKQTLIHGGKYIQEGVARSSATLGWDAENGYKIAYAQTFDNQLYTFPLRSGSTYTDRNKADGTAWTPTEAYSGIPMILWDSNVLTTDQVLCNDGGGTDWYAGDALSARAAIGITQYGKLFLYCGQQVDGSVGTSMKGTAQIMKDLGCVAAFTLEGSSTPDLRVNKMETVKNSKIFNGESPKLMQGALAFK